MRLGCSAAGRLGQWLGLALALAACGRTPGAPGSVSPGPVAAPATRAAPASPLAADVEVVRIGGRAYTGAHFRSRAQVESVYFGTAIPESATAAQVIESALMKAVLERRGITITEELLEAEEARVDRESMDRERLAQIKAVFGSDRGRYREVFLEPVLVNQRLYDYLQASDETQGDRRRAAGALLESARAQPSRFRELVAQAGGQYVVQTQKPEGRYTAEERRQYGGDVPGLDGALINSCLQSLPAGQFCPRVIEDRHALKIVRLVERRAGEYRVEVGIVRKRSFEEWFPAEARKVPVAWRDPTLGAAFSTPRAAGPGAEP